ncbi:hypothetical protein [Allorhizobium taibaishanense]|uniref:Uncharacterized protein n=1 Tax=Allorhizobium taibaishanense TaxID=887144 RepID=A0A1Q9A2V8_9HYPH|nr:hypothetical protein [Allorhizobium taibaishanense]MBB4005824.1 hypothetical protein [Allorhizobium taibaishanense]OLP48872.1 hypothetical protein BJF91_17205 [Allorhizobium taibaishanense]
MKPAGLFVCTDNPQQAAIDLFRCDPELVPAWAKIVSDVAEIAAIPTKAKVINRWYGSPGLFEQVWREERLRREFDMDYAVHVAALEAWHDKRWAEACAPPAEPAPLADRQDHAPPAARAASPPSSSAHSRQSRWL